MYSPNFQALSAFRILFSAYLLVEFASIFPFYGDFYSGIGILPLSALATDRSIAGIGTLLPLLQLAERSGLAAIVPFAYPASLVALALGYRTRWACSLAFLLNAYLFWRNPYLRSGAETLAHLLLLWCLFLPLNRYWSVDAALDRQSRDRPYPRLPFFAVRLQISSLYFFSALFKLEGEPWRHGYAIAWALQDGVFGSTSAGLFLVRNFPNLLVVVNFAVIAFQLAFPYLIYSPWRNGLTRAVAIAGAVAMHASFIVLLNIGFFPYLCLVMVLLLVPDAWIDRLLHRRRERLRVVMIYFEPGCGFCEKVSLLLREFLLSPTAAVLPASADPAALRLLTEHRSWVVVDPDGNRHLKWRAMAYVLKQNPLLAPLGWATDLAIVRPFMQRVYDAIGGRRRMFGAVARALLPTRSEPPIGRFALALCASLAALALLCNVISLDRWSAERSRQEVLAAADTGMRAWLDEFFAAIQVRQVWALFAPVPTHWDWTFRFRTAREGSSEAGPAESWPFIAASADGRVSFSHHYWAKYFTRFNEFTPADWQGFGTYLCRIARGPTGAASEPFDALEVMISLKPVAYPARAVPGLDARRQFNCGARDSGHRLEVTG